LIFFHSPRSRYPFLRLALPSMCMDYFHVPFALPPFRPCPLKDLSDARCFTLKRVVLAQQEGSHSSGLHPVPESLNASFCGRISCSGRQMAFLRPAFFFSPVRFGDVIRSPAFLQKNSPTTHPRPIWFPAISLLPPPNILIFGP